MMISDKIKRTILFETFSRTDGIARLDFIIGKSDSNVVHKEVINKLMVKSFDEFMEKFEPCYYECMSMYDDGMPRFDYKLSPSGNAKCKKLADQPFYKAIMRAYKEKNSSGQNNYDFNFSDILDVMYSPEKAMNDVRDIRARLVYNYTQYKNIDEKGGSEYEKEEYAREYNKLRRRIANDYIMSQSQFDLLPLYIDDTRARLNALEQNKTAEESNESGQNGQIKYIDSITFGSDGAPKFNVLSYSDSDDNIPLLESGNSNNYQKLIAERIGKDFDVAADKGKNALVALNDDESTAYMRNMIVSIFAGKPAEEKNISIPQLKANLKIYEEMYKISQQNFAENVVVLLEKVLGVKAFFDNAGKDAELIIANCTLSELTEEKNYKMFSDFIKDERIGSDDKIWFAVVPRVYHNEIVIKNSSGNKRTSIDDDIEDDIFEENQSKDISMTRLSTLNQVLELFSQNLIITFFNFCGCKNTSFSDLNSKLVEEYKRVLKPITEEPEISKYAVFCYPNFTILPERERTVHVGSQSSSNILLPDIYVDASYVAAGIMVKTHNNQNLNNKGFSTLDDIAPVRFDFECSFRTDNGELVPLAHIFPTEFPCETVLPWRKDLVDEIRKDGGFGFCFCGDKKAFRYKKSDITQKKSYVFKARTLAKDEMKNDDGELTGEKKYRPIFKTLVNAYLRIMGEIETKEKIEKLCDNSPNESYLDKINNLIYSNGSSNVKNVEEIEYKGSTITIKYNNDESGVAVEEINEN